MLFLRLIMRDERGQIAHQWGFYPESIPSMGDYVSLQIRNVSNSGTILSTDMRFIRCLIRSRELTPSCYNAPILDQPVDEWECEVTTEESIENGWFADSEVWTAKELAEAEKLKEGDT